ncbi:PH domain-containing protein [Ferruginibacter albus]|uniref:PH domain-containing protein n=1 Tax=Ferruginibacter albus TaxID=2875540 RepID=UPI001CC4899A|nr:PH domain-containing protein [Ferruginibacter albus]UAY50932.1 PH domain-containing protein [Ferruginibacter albus]
MASIFNKKLLPGFDSIKDNDEKIIWIGRSKFIPFIFSGIWAGISIIAFVATWIAIGTQIKPENGNIAGWEFWLGLLPVIFFLWLFFKRLFSFNNTYYAYSDRRVMMRTGFIGTDFKIIDYDKISGIEVTVNFIERVYNVGTIKFFSNRTQVDEGDATKLYDNWEAIPNPYEVFKEVKKVMIDIKIGYNNASDLQLETNPSYEKGDVAEK